MSVKEWFTARELAEAAARRGLRNFPQSERGVQMIAKREGWNELPSNLCRIRSGREGGGGREYHFSVFAADNPFLTAALRREEMTALQLAAQANRQDDDRRKLTAMNTMSLSARQRTVMEKRAEILVAIERYKTMRDLASDREAILAFVSAQERYAAWKQAEERRDQGVLLNAAELVLLSREPDLVSPDAFDLTPAALEIANNRPKGNGRVSRATIYEWIKARKAGGVAALAPALTKADEAISEEFKTFLTYYAKPAKPAATEALEDYRTDYPDSNLTIDQVYYALEKKLNSIERYVGREGLLTLRSRMAYIQRSTENLFPTTIYTADGKTFDAEVAHPVTNRPFKPEITSILDVATRKCVGFSIALKENVISVTEALRNSCCYHGIPAIFYTDRGPGYKNKTFDGDVNGLMGRLSITKMHALPYNSQAKGIIERFNGTVWNPLARKYPTYLGEEMDKEAASAAHKATRRDIAQFGFSKVLPTWEEFRRDCEAAIAAYNDRPHDSLAVIEDPKTGKRRHMSPNEAWRMHVAAGFEPVPVDDDIRDDLFRPYEIRVTRRSLVEWNRNTYFHPALEGWHGEKVMVGYDFSDADKVWVREIDREAGQPGPLICVAEFGGNKVDYVPRTFQAAAEDKRRAGRLRRIENKARDIREEFIAPFLIDQSAEPMPMIDITPEPMPASGPQLVVDNSSETPIAASGAAESPRRRTFASDEELAAWALENPESLTVNQVRVLRQCLQRQTAVDLFRMSGIDVDQLRNIIRAAA